MESAKGLRPVLTPEATTATTGSTAPGIMVDATASTLLQQFRISPSAPIARRIAITVVFFGSGSILIADVKMPGNGELELVREARRLTQGMPVMLVTGDPCLDSAINSVQLSVAAYLTKPLDSDELRDRVRVLMERSGSHRTISKVRRHLWNCVHDLEDIECGGPSPPDAPRGAAGMVSIVTIRTLASCLSELLRMNAARSSDGNSSNLCELLDCPQQPAHRVAIRETIEVLKKTKSTFKSKELAELRARLERLLEKPK